MKKTCKNCWQKGHNVRSCVNETIYRPPKKARPRGRPRKAQPLTTVRSSITLSARRGGGLADETMKEASALELFVPDEVHTGQESPDVEQVHFGMDAQESLDVEELHSGDQLVDQKSPPELGNQIDVGHELDGEPIEVGYEIDVERFEQGHDHMNGDGLDVVSQQSSKEESPDGDDLYEPSQWSGESKKRKKSERILKRKLSKPVYDEDGGGSAIDKPLILD